MKRNYGTTSGLYAPNKDKYCSNRAKAVGIAALFGLLFFGLGGVWGYAG